MGQVRVVIAGSFGGYHDNTFSAEDGGHALALTRAMRELVSMMPHAIRLDHELHASGDHPPGTPFGTTHRGQEKDHGAMIVDLGLEVCGGDETRSLSHDQIAKKVNDKYKQAVGVIALLVGSQDLKELESMVRATEGMPASDDKVAGMRAIEFLLKEAGR